MRKCHNEQLNRVLNIYIYNMPQYHIFEYLFCVKIYFFILILFLGS